MKKIVVRALLLGFVFCTNLVWAEGTLDLETPFAKTLIFKKTTGVMEEREIKGVKIVEGKVESTTSNGVLLSIPTNEVVGLLPKLPDGGIIYQSKDIDRAIGFLEALPENLKQRPEASTDALQKWRDLKKPAEEADARRATDEKKLQEEKTLLEEKKIQEWVRSVTDFDKPKSERDLAEAREQGQRFLDLKIGDESKVRDGLALLSQVVGKEKGGPLPDLVKLDEIQPKIMPNDLLVWIVVGILTVSFFGLLIGLSFASSGYTRFREGAILGGIVYGGVGISLLAGLVAIWWPVGEEGDAVDLAVSSEMKRVVTFAKNSVKPVYYLPCIEIRVPAKEFATGILASLSPSEEAVGIFKGKLKQGELWIAKDRYLWRQPVTALGVPVPVNFIFGGKMPSPASWQDIPVERVSIGKVTIPKPLSSALADELKSSLASGLSMGGFSGIGVKSGESNELLLSIKSSGKMPSISTTMTTTAYRKEITAEDLAKVFVEKKGTEFNGKFVCIEGVVDKVNSGNEFSGSANAGVSEPQNKDKTPLKLKNDEFDIFYLHGMDAYGYRKDPLYIKLVIKSPLVFAMDQYGDVYQGPNANIVKDKPMIKKGYRVKFLKEGRVQGDQIKNNEIEIYGVEIDGDGDIKCFDPAAPVSK